MSDFPDGLVYTKDHEWILVTGDRGRRSDIEMNEDFRR